MSNDDIEIVKTELPINESERSAIAPIKSGFCQSLSGRSTLSYEIGVVKMDGDSNADVGLDKIYFRIMANSAKGMFNDDWVSVETIFEVINLLPLGHSLTSSTFHPIFQGKSLNTSGFLLATLKEESLVLKLPGKRAGYERVMPDSFLIYVRNLIVNSTTNQVIPDIPIVGGKTKTKRR